MSLSFVVNIDCRERETGEFCPRKILAITAPSVKSLVDTGRPFEKVDNMPMLAAAFI
jgi:hypothetical protein